jgi:hypothetical protein
VPAGPRGHVLQHISVDDMLRDQPVSVLLRYETIMHRGESKVQLTQLVHSLHLQFT